MTEPKLTPDIRYSLDWIEVGNHVVPLVRTWRRDRSKKGRRKRYVYVPHDKDRRAWDKPSYFRPIRIRRSKSSLLTLDELIATVRATALREPTEGEPPPDARHSISPRVTYHVSPNGQQEHGSHYVISTYLIRRPNPGGCCDPRDFRTAAELNLRRGRLVARPNPPHWQRGDFASHFCSWDRIDLQIRSWDWNREQLQKSKQQTPPSNDDKPVVAYIFKDAIHHVDALPLCDHIAIEDCSNASLDELHLAARASRIWINRGTVEAKHIDQFRSVPNLREIATFQTLITDGALRRLRWLPKGVKLSLDFAILNNDSAALLAQIPGLDTVQFLGHDVENLYIRKLTRCQSLRSLSIKRCRVNHFGLELLPQLPGLESLGLTDCRLTPRALSVLGQCQGLQRLYLTCDALTDKYCPQLAALPKLERLSIKGTRVTDRGLARLAKCTTLKVLAISGCRGITRPAIELFGEERPDVKLISAGMF